MPSSASQLYHEFTKYSPEGLARHSRPLDWNTQPLPFKEYPSGLGTVFPLKMYLSQKLSGYSPVEGASGSLQLDLSKLGHWQRQRLSQLLYFTYGVTLIVPYPTQPLYMRSAPSAGGLYPVELYLLSLGTEGFPPGLYNYQARTHSLLQFWDESRFDLLEKACFGVPALAQTKLVLLATVVFFRSAWRYQDRAYRRVCLDTGHLLGNLSLASNLTGFRAYLMGGFGDALVEELLFLEQGVEAPICVLPLVDLWQNPEHPLGAYQEPFERLSLPKVLASERVTSVPDLKSGEWLPYMDQVSRLSTNLESIGSEQGSADKYNFPFCWKVSTRTDPIYWGVHLQDLVRSILKRRSTREFSGEKVDWQDLLAILDFTHHPEHYSDQGLDPKPDYFDLSLVQTFVVANGVNGLDPGCYYYAPDAEELRQIRFKDFRQEVHYLCLGQDLGRDAGAIIFQTADLEQAVTRYGERSYRYLHMDAGHLGQRINLAAIRLGLGVSGIAGFFDDQVNEVLGIPVSEAVLYITTLGCQARNT